MHPDISQEQCCFLLVDSPPTSQPLALDDITQKDLVREGLVIHDLFGSKPNPPALDDITQKDLVREGLVIHDLFGSKPNPPALDDITQKDLVREGLVSRFNLFGSKPNPNHNPNPNPNPKKRKGTQKEKKRRKKGRTFGIRTAKLSKTRLTPVQQPNNQLCQMAIR